MVWAHVSIYLRAKRKSATADTVAAEFSLERPNLISPWPKASTHLGLPLSRDLGQRSHAICSSMPTTGNPDPNIQNKHLYSDMLHKY